MSVRILIKQTDMPSCVFIKTCWSLSKAYCIPGKLCHFQSSGIFKLQKNGWHYEKTSVIFGLSAPKNIKKHQKIKIKKSKTKNLLPSDLYGQTIYKTGLCINLNQGWGTCGLREHLTWPVSEFSLPKSIQHRVKTKLHVKRVLSKSREDTLPHS